MNDKSSEKLTHESQEDPWAKLSDQERKRAETHLRLLYLFMIVLVVLPFVVFFLFKK